MAQLTTSEKNFLLQNRLVTPEDILSAIWSRKDDNGNG